jgi:RNA polymerase sigma-70 factor, ECF subfamily
MMDETERFIPNALVQLYPKLKRFAVNLTGSLDRADDLVQHACERALSHSAPGLPETRLDRWLYRVMYHAWIDQQRRAGLRTRAPLDDAGGVPGAGGGSQAEDRLMLDEVYQELLRLPEDQRTVLTLVCLDGLSYRETAEILGISIGTVMSRVSRARLILAKRLEAPLLGSDNVQKQR